MSASIAHEIRNPVGAMSHAAQLLRESASLSPQDQRLTDIIHTNGTRVSSIVENVLQLSRRDSTRQERIDLGTWLDEFLAEFRKTLQLDDAEVRFAPPRHDLEVRVDPSHLHQLLWNLCENACKYGRTAEGQVSIDIMHRTRRAPISARTSRWPIAARASMTPTRNRSSSRSSLSGPGGTGLGLFIARELAQCNRAVLFYEPRQGGGSIFRIVFADPQRWEV